MCIRDSVIVMESQRVAGLRPYHLTRDFRITDNIMPLSKFELQCGAHAVSTVFKFHVEGSAGDGPATGGVYLRPVRADVITAPAEYKSKTKTKAESQDEAADNCEDLGKDKPQSDLESDDEYAVYANDDDQVFFDESGNSPNSSLGTWSIALPVSVIIFAQL